MFLLVSRGHMSNWNQVEQNVVNDLCVRIAFIFVHNASSSTGWITSKFVFFMYTFIWTQSGCGQYLDTWHILMQSFNGVTYLRPKALFIPVTCIRLLPSDYNDWNTFWSWTWVSTTARSMRPICTSSHCIQISFPRTLPMLDLLWCIY